jgi:hypothetical protein
MANVKMSEVSTDVPEDFDYSSQELTIFITAKPVGSEEDGQIETDIKCKMHGTNTFAKSVIHAFLEQDEVMLHLFRDVIANILLEKMMSDRSPMIMGRGGDA